jgi:glycerophosphoryl diester phosphodiesterase
MKIYAHRGASQDFPEMTMAAYEEAVKQGTDGFECDLRLSKDGVAVLWHDTDLQRCAENKAVVSGSTYAQLKSIYPQILNIDEILDYAISQNKSLFLETKHPVPSRTAIESLLVEKITSEAKRIKRAEIEVNVMSFSWLAIEHIKQLDKDIETTYLWNNFIPWFNALHSSARSLGPEITHLQKNPELANRIKGAGRKLNVWTVNDPSDIRLCYELGVDNLITDRPGFAREVISKIK